jgi:hypothetical protein
MKYMLKHGNIDVCEITLNEKHNITENYTVLNEDHFPIGILSGGKVDIVLLDDWFFKRGLTNDRSSIQNVLEANNVKDGKELTVKNSGLSVIDGYWIDKDNRKWEDVNIYDNFKKKGLEAVYLGEGDENTVEGISANKVSGGNLPKVWIRMDDGLKLIKGSKSAYKQEIYNEVAASVLSRYLGINHVEYQYTVFKNKRYSMCANMLGRDEELTEAYFIFASKGQAKGISNKQHYLERCKELFGLKGEKEIDMMIVLDYLLQNEDRHYRNFGIVRNIKSLEGIRIAPVFDNGNSLWYNSDADEIRNRNNYMTKGLKSKFSDYINLVSDFGWIKKIDRKIVRDIMENEFALNKFMESERKELILEKVSERIVTINRKAGYEEERDGIGKPAKKDVNGRKRYSL